MAVAILRALSVPCFVLAVSGCADEGARPPEGAAPAAPRARAPEAFSLLGDPLIRPALDAPTAARLEADLEQARLAHERDPRGEETTIWLGRRLAYLGRHAEAIAVFSRGLEEHPRSFKLLRHRGHRFLTIRRLDLAVSDLERAAALSEGIPDEVEPDGAPNSAGIPRSTSHSNILYHLGLAHYLLGDYARAAEAYRRCLKFAAVNDDMLGATSYWLYLALRRDRRDAEAAAVLAPIHEEMEILENRSYHLLLRMFKEELSPEAAGDAAGEGAIDRATVSYGIAVSRLLRGEGDDAVTRFRDIVSGTPWPAFAHLAAEAELARPGVVAPHN